MKSRSIESINKNQKGNQKKEDKDHIQEVQVHRMKAIVVAVVVVAVAVETKTKIAIIISTTTHRTIVKAYKKRKEKRKNTKRKAIGKPVYLNHNQVKLFPLVIKVEY